MAILALPTLIGERPHRADIRINCANNLKQVGLAFKLWAGDNDDKYPQEYAGSIDYPLINNPNAGTGIGAGVSWPVAGTACPSMFTVYLSMSNELSTRRSWYAPKTRSAPPQLTFIRILR